MRFIHTADIHLGKTYRNPRGAESRYGDFFQCLQGIVTDAISKQVDLVLIAGDLFHTGQILPETFARTIKVLQPLKDAGIPCVAVEGNHDWIHRRDSISWMEALSHMGYIRLLRPARGEDGSYRFDPFDEERGVGGRITIGGLNLYGLGYIGSQAGQHIERICQAVNTEHNLLLFHVGIWKYSPVEIGNVKLEEAHPLATVFEYVALGHGHKPYTIATPEGKTYAFNPGAPERVNFGEERYDKGYYLVTAKEGHFAAEFCPTSPRPMWSLVVDLGGSDHAGEAMDRLREQVMAAAAPRDKKRRPLLEIKLTGRVGFHPFELGRERLILALSELVNPLHLEVRNNLSLVTDSGGEELVQKNLAEIEKDVLHELIGSGSDYRGRESQMIRLAMAMRDAVLRGTTEGEELLDLLNGEV